MRRVMALALALLLAGCAVDNGLARKRPDATPSPSSSTPAVAGGLQPGADGIGDPYFPKDGNGGYDVTNYDLTVGYDPATDRLTGREIVTATATQGLSRFNLDFHGLDLASVKVNDTAATFTRKGDELTVVPAQGLTSGSSFKVELAYGGVPDAYTKDGLGQVGFVKTNDGALAQGEPKVAASWYAVNDHPRDKATYRISITAPSDLAALSNGVLLSTTPSGATTTWVWNVTSPMASYLATIVIGKYRVKQSTHNGMPVVTAVHASLSASIDRLLDRTPEIVDFLATQFGPYPFDAMGGVVHNSNAIGFALENQTRPVYSAGFFGGTALDDGAWVLAHELAHQWYGDSVSVRDWKDVWLNEGFATYAEWLWTEHLGKGTVEETFRGNYDRPDEFWNTPTANPGKDLFANSFPIYDRGAMTLQALRKKVGDADFFAIIKGWAGTRKDGNASTEDFIAYSEQVSGENLKALFDDWLYGTDKPLYPPR